MRQVSREPVCSVPCFCRCLPRRIGKLLPFHHLREPLKHCLSRVAEISASGDTIRRLQLDENFQSWRYHHFHLVRRIIGDQVKSLKGVPAAMLASTTTERVYPALWDAVSELTRTVSPHYG